jgi:hypothetical protein
VVVAAFEEADQAVEPHLQPESHTIAFLLIRSVNVADCEKADEAE